ncbi:contractile injection system tape measure protein [Aliikangiella sp. IMCC44359]|uniref:contractile injection system tape measure protein n=1 Tax=Aliikangiella sp. IMCC44359 TaxID=3459125 RepID=UPI00403AC0FF
MVIASQHKIRKQSIEVLVDSEELAVQLQSKIPEINKRYLLSIIETVFNEVDTTEQVIKVDKINIDLGWFDASELQEDINECLGDKLRLTLRELLLDKASSCDVKIFEENQDKIKVIREDINISQIKLVEHYLSTGTLPWSYHQSAYFKLDDIFYDVIIDNAKAFTESIKRYGHQQQVIQRMVAQLSRENLRRILYLLEPDDFLLITTYMKELKLIHTSKPVVKLSIDWFEKLIWILTLTYSLNQRGSYFNRQSYVKSVLVGIAQREGIEYGMLLKALSLGVQKVARKKPLGSSLPGIIGRLIETQQQNNKSWNENEFFNTEIDKGYSIKKHNENNNLLFVELEGFLLKRHVNENHIVEVDYLCLRNNVEQLKPKEYKSIKLLIAQCLKKHPENSFAFSIKLLQLFSLTKLLSIFSVKEKNRVKEHLNEIVAYINVLDNKLKNEIEQELQLGVVQYLLANYTKPFKLDKMLYTVLASYAEVNRLRLSLVYKSIIQQANQNDTSLSRELVSKLSNDNQWKTEYKSSVNKNVFQSYIANKKIFNSYDKLSLLEHYLNGYIVFDNNEKKEGKGGASVNEIQCLKSIELIISLLSASQIKSLVVHHNNDKQVLKALRLINGLSEENIDILLKKLLPQSLLKNTLFFQSVHELAEQFSNKKLFFSIFLSEMINNQFDGDCIDLDSMLSDDKYAGSIKVEKLLLKNSFFTEDVNDWSQSQLESVIVGILNNQYDKLPKLFTISSLLELLMKKKNVGVRLFFVALYEDSKLYSQLLTNVSSDTYEEIIKVVQPEGAPYLNTLMHDLETAPIAYRCSQIELRKTFFEKAMQMQYPLTEKLFYQIFCQLYANEISKPLEKHLITTSNKWHEKADFDHSIANSFEQAVNMICEKQISQTAIVDGNQEKINELVEQSNSIYQFLFDCFSKEQMSTFKLTQATQPLMKKLFERPEPSFQQLIKQKNTSFSIRQLWVNHLPESILARIVWLLAPNTARQLLEYNEILMGALTKYIKNTNHQILDRSKFWLFLLEFLANKKTVQFNLERFVFEFFGYAKNISHHDLPPFNKKTISNDSDLINKKKKMNGVNSGVALVESVKASARRSGQQALLSLLKKRTEQLLDVFCQGKQIDLVMREISNKDKEQINSSKKRKRPVSLNNDEVELDDVLYVENSGLILTGVFLPHLFNSLNMLVTNEDGQSQFKDDLTISRAVHLLQYLVDGSVCTPEPLLILNKLMCGQSPEFVVEQSIVINEQEKALCEQLLKALISRWSSINNTSIVGLQETFFQREGRLIKTSDGWRLKVQRKTVDILLEQISWRTSIISEAWMSEPIHVSWQ